MRTRTRFPPSRLAFAAGLAVLMGCTTSPIKQRDINGDQVSFRPAAPQPIFSDMDHVLACLGDHIRDQKIKPQLIGYPSVADTTGKTGVDFVALMRSALSKIIARGSPLSATSMGFGPSTKPEGFGAEERDLMRNPAYGQRLARPDWLITGGSVSVTNAFISIQNSGGLSSRAIDIARSSTATVELASLSFGMKWAESGIDMPMRTVDVRVSWQVLSSATEVGVFAQASLNDKRLNAGLRAGRTVASAQVVEDAIRVGIEWAVASLLASRFSVDLSTCPMYALTPDKLLPKGERLPAVTELPKIYADMSPTERIRWFQATLAARNYAPGPIDGQLGPRTREALSRAAQDNGLPPNGQGSDTLFYVLARRELAFGRDPRKPLPADASAPARIHVQLSQPDAQYVQGAIVLAKVVPPQAGFMHCWLVDNDGPLPLYPIAAGRSNFVNAGNPVLLPGNNQNDGKPRVTLTASGPHELWCGQSRKNVDERLPAELRAGGDSRTSVSAVRQAYAKAAGSDWLAEGSVMFNVLGSTTTR